MQYFRIEKQTGTATRRRLPLLVRGGWAPPEILSTAEQYRFERARVVGKHF